MLQKKTPLHSSVWLYVYHVNDDNTVTFASEFGIDRISFTLIQLAQHLYTLGISIGPALLKAGEDCNIPGKMLTFGFDCVGANLITRGFFHLTPRFCLCGLAGNIFWTWRTKPNRIGVSPEARICQASRIATQCHIQTSTCVVLCFVNFVLCVYVCVCVCVCIWFEQQAERKSKVLDLFQTYIQHGKSPLWPGALKFLRADKQKQRNEPYKWGVISSHADDHAFPSLEFAQFGNLCARKEFVISCSVLVKSSHTCDALLLTVRKFN